MSRTRVDERAAAVRVAAVGASSWASLTGRVRACTACPELASTRTTVVVGQFPRDASLAVLGEAPGAEEDATGEPFVGRSGRLLDELLADAGMPRARVAVLNALKCRPPGNRRPTVAESARCRGWLDRQLELVDPAVLVVLGGTAIDAVLGKGTKVTAVRGRARELGGRLVLPTYHPSAALRFGPAGEPRRLLAADLRSAVALARDLRRLGIRWSRAGVTDAEALHAVTQAAYAGPLSEGVEDVAADLAVGGGVVGRYDGELVAGLRFATARDGSGARWVRRVVVHPRVQRQGVGRALMEWAHAVSRSDGVATVRLGMRGEVRRFYEALGYAVGAEREGWTEMARDL